MFIYGIPSQLSQIYLQPSPPKNFQQRIILVVTNKWSESSNLRTSTWS